MRVRTRVERPPSSQFSFQQAHPDAHSFPPPQAFLTDSRRPPAMPACPTPPLVPDQEALPLPDELGSSRFCFTLQTHLSSFGRLTCVVREGNGN